jgi:hypothetical protein
VQITIESIRTLQNQARSALVRNEHCAVAALLSKEYKFLMEFSEQDKNKLAAQRTCGQILRMITATDWSYLSIQGTMK